MSPDLLPLSGLAGWLLTYLLHSSLLLAAALLLPRIPAARSRPALQETALKLALVGGILTATLRPHLPHPPGAIHLSLPHPRPPSITTPSSDPTSPPRPPISSPSTAPASPAAHPRWYHYEEYDSSPNHGIGIEPGEGAARSGAGTGWLMAAVAAAATLAAGRRAVQRLSFQRRLARAVPLQTGPLAKTLSRLAHMAGLRQRVRLYVTDAIVAPCAAGLARPRIYLPRRVVVDLAPPEQEALLAHELAHLCRRDPAWLALWQLLEAILFLQPLNHFARCRFQELAEFRCDAEAARLIGSGLPLARCLTEVAAWFAGTSDPGWSQPATAGMALDRSTLARRVGSLLETHDRPDSRQDAAGRAGWIIGVLALALVLFAAPGFAFRGNRAPAPAAAPAPAPAPAAEEQHASSGVPGPGARRTATSPGAPYSGQPPFAAGLAAELAALDADLARLQAEAAGARKRLVAAAPLAPDFDRLLLELDRRIAALAERRRALSRAAAESLSYAAAPGPTRGGDLNPNPNP